MSTLKYITLVQHFLRSKKWKPKVKAMLLKIKCAGYCNLLEFWACSLMRSQELPTLLRY